MAVNKVLFGGETVIDLTSDTVTADSLMKGVTAHAKDGNLVTGTFTLESELTQQDSLISQIQNGLKGKATSENLSNELEEQDDLIAQIIAALEQKQTPKQ